MTSSCFFGIKPDETSQVTEGKNEPLILILKHQRGSQGTEESLKRLKLQHRTKWVSACDHGTKQGCFKRLEFPCQILWGYLLKF